MKKTIRSRNFMYTQDIDHLPFKKDDLASILEKSRAQEWAYILHDKDVDENKKKIRPHYHVMMRFKDAKTITKISKIFGDKPQYIEAWHNTINNGFSYLIHETSGSQNKYHYDISEVTASFDFKAKIESIRRKVRKPSRQAIEDYIENYSNGVLTKETLQDQIGVLEMAKHKTLLDHIDQILDQKKHNEFLEEFKGQKCVTYWLWGESGVGKTRLVREALEKCIASTNFCILGSQRDHFQVYEGQNHIVINDLRPNDYSYGQLLMLLDPWENDKMAPARYRDKYLNAKSIFITTPYDPLSFYNGCYIENMVVDSFEQLKRRILPLHVTTKNADQIKEELIKDLEIRKSIFQMKAKQKASHTDQSND